MINITDILASKVNKGISILHEKENLKVLQKLLINISLSKDQIEGKYKVSELGEFYQIKFYLKDIDFCLCKVIIDNFRGLSNDYPFKSQIISTYLNNDKRFLFYLEYQVQTTRHKGKIEDEQAKAYNKAIKYNDTIVLGDKQFHNLINQMKLPYEPIYCLNEKEFENCMFLKK